MFTVSVGYIGSLD